MSKVVAGSRALFRWQQYALQYPAMSALLLGLSRDISFFSVIFIVLVNLTAHP